MEAFMNVQDFRQTLSLLEFNICYRVVSTFSCNSLVAMEMEKQFFARWLLVEDPSCHFTMLTSCMWRLLTSITPLILLSFVLGLGGTLLTLASSRSMLMGITLPALRWVQVGLFGMNLVLGLVVLLLEIGDALMLELFAILHGLSFLLQLGISAATY